MPKTEPQELGAEDAEDVMAIGPRQAQTQEKGWMNRGCRVQTCERSSDINISRNEEPKVVRKQDMTSNLTPILEAV